MTNAYKTLPVHWRTLENLGNFKGLLAGRVRRVHHISQYRGFRVRQEGPAIVLEVKNNMHDAEWLGFSADGKVAGIGDDFEPHRLFYATSLRLEACPEYEYLVVEKKTRDLVQQRYLASHQRLEASFPGGKLPSANTTTILQGETPPIYFCPFLHVPQAPIHRVLS